MIIYLLIFITIWLSVVSWVLFKTRQHYLNLTSRIRKQRIDEILEELLSTEKTVVEDLKSVKKEIQELSNQGRLHLQKIGLVRFNPFERSGGEQSFVLALLDNKQSGIAINFIYTRDGLRVYTKKVKEGKGEKYELSEEEKRAIINSNQ